MRVKEMADVISESLFYTVESDDQCEIVDVTSFKDEGVLTNDVGLVVRTRSNEVFYMTIAKR